MAFLSIRIKVPSHPTIFRLIFPFDAVSTKNRSVWTQKSKVKLKHCFKIGWHPISGRQSNEHCMARTVKIRIFFQNWMETMTGWTCGHSTFLFHRCRIVQNSDRKSYQVTALYNMVGLLSCIQKKFSQFLF